MQMMPDMISEMGKQKPYAEYGATFKLTANGSKVL